MTLLLLAGIIVLAVTQQATFLYYVKLGMDETTKARLLDGLLLGLILILAFQFETQGMRGAVLIAYLVVRCVAEGFRKKFKKLKKDKKVLDKWVEGWYSILAVARRGAKVKS